MLRARVTKWFIALVTQAFIFGGLAQAECKGPPSTRSHLVDRGHEVYDTETDLTWAKCSVGMKWVGGKCIGVATMGTWTQANETKWPDGWRMPSVEELQTIVATNCKAPAIDESMFPKTVPDKYWTTRQTDRDCWYVGFWGGGAEGHVIYCSGYPGAVRLVRGGQ